MRLLPGLAITLIVMMNHGSIGQAAPSENAVELLRQGEALASANRLAEAEVILEKGIALTGNNEQLLTLLAEVKSRLGENAEAVVLFRKVVHIHPASGQAHLNLAIALADAGSTKESLQELDSAVRFDTRNPRIHLNRARVLADLQRTTEARREFLRAKQLGPSEAEIDYFWAVFEKDDHKPIASASLFSRVVAQEPENAHALFFLGQMQQLNGRDQDAIASWRKAVACDPSMQEAVYALSQALRVSSPDESKELLETFERQHAASQNVEHIRELGNQAYSEMENHNWDAAITILQNAITLCKGCSLTADLHQRLGLARCHRGDLEDGERELRLALSLNPRDRETVRALEWVANQKEIRKANLN